MSILRVSVTTLAAVSLSVIMSSCKETNADKVADAQECLDRYAREGGGDLSACEAIVEGINTRAAHGIRCATGFIREGFGSAQTFIDAFKEIETVSGNSVRAFLRVVTFDSAGTGSTTAVDNNYNLANSVYTSCAASYAKGATMIATFSFLTNVLYKYECDNTPVSAFMGNCNMDDTDLAAALAVGATDGTGSTATMKADLGTIVINTNTVSCSTGATNKKLCEFMQKAIDDAGGTADKAKVGEKFLEVLANPPP